MKAFTRARTRRHLFAIAAAGAASIPFIASAGNARWARDKEWGDKDWDDPEKKEQNHQHNCFLKGTRISTLLREQAVEDLQIGDIAHTHNGPKPIKWIGHDRFRKTKGKAWVESVMPIRVARFALDDHTPNRDLYLSPAHCLFLDDVLIPVRHLVNDMTITAHSLPDLDTIEYYHIEFEAHELIFAEGASVESYLGSNRESFLNFVQYERLYGADGRSSKMPFAPIVGYYGGRDEVKGLVRSIISNVVDVRDPIQIASDRLAQRAKAIRL